MTVVIGRSRVNPSRRPSHLLGDLLRLVVEVFVPADWLIDERNPHVRG
jgi:hypothetical protein